MKPIAIYLFLIALVLIICQTSSQEQINKSRETLAANSPAEAVREAGNTSVVPINLMGRSFAAFKSPAFQKDKLTGRKSTTTAIDENRSINEIPGQPTSLKNWMYLVANIPENMISDLNYSTMEGIGRLRTDRDWTDRDWTHNPGIVQLQMTPQTPKNSSPQI